VIVQSVLSLVAAEAIVCWVRLFAR